MILYLLVSRIEEHNMKRVKEIEKIEKVKGIEIMGKIKKQIKAIREIK